METTRDFILLKRENGGAADYKFKLMKENKEMKALKTKSILNLHLLGIRGSVKILVPGCLRKALDL